VSELYARLETPVRRAVTDSYEYDAFGNQITHTGSTPNNYLYRGEQYDPDLGLYYLRARYYNPLTGRFMSRDPYEPKLRGPDGTPIDLKKLHRYLYAGADPVNIIDPSGQLLSETVVKITASVVATTLVTESIIATWLAAEREDVHVEQLCPSCSPYPVKGSFPPLDWLTEYLRFLENEESE
jgi:RHS repeat-associated protein